MTLIPRVIVAGMIVGSAASAEDTAVEPVAKFAGWYEYDPDTKPNFTPATGDRINRAATWEFFLEDLPAKVPGDTTRLDAPNDDPALTTKIDWEKQMIVRVTSRTHVPRIVSVSFRDDLNVTPRGRLLAVEFTVEEDVSAHPANWGHYAAWVVPKTNERVYFRPVKKPVGDDEKQPPK